MMFFAGPDHYARGGWRDFQLNVTSIEHAEQCIAELDEHEAQWAHVVSDGEVVAAWAWTCLDSEYKVGNWKWRRQPTGDPDAS